MKHGFNRFPKRASAWLALVLTGGMHAQAADMSPVVVTAGRIAQSEETVSADVTVLDRQAIERSQKTTVADLLRGLPGVDVASSGGPGKATSVFLRGANAGQTLVLIDGVRVGSATLGQFDWGQLATAGIERIEIIRGPQSSLYGADAMGGVIQIFTRKGGDTPEATAHVEGGSYGTAAGRAHVSGRGVHGMRYALSVDGYRTRGVSAAAVGAEPDSYRRLTVSGRVGLPLGDGELDLSIRNVDGKTGLDGFPPPNYTLADIYNFTSQAKQLMAGATLDYPLTAWWETSLRLGRSMDEVINHDPATASNNADFRTRIDQVVWQNHLDWRDFSVVLGLDIHRDRGVSGSAGLDRTITQRAGFASLSWGHSWMDANAAVRHDRNSVSRNKTTYKLGLALRPVSGLKLTANYGTGFKAPSINDLYFPTSAFAGGNPNLKPETSKGWDVGLDYRTTLAATELQVGAVWFDQRFENLIEWRASPTFFYSPVNVGKARTRGLELNGRVAYGPLYLAANWTFLRAINELDGTRLARRAKDSGSLRLGGEWHRVSGEVQTIIVGPRFSASGNQQPLRGYHRTDVRLRYRLDDQWTLVARGENLEDKRYEEVAGYGVFGRAFYGGVSASF
ncbi:MAG: TonB-dependent receptor [Zetaproteobacteria bacterium]|nr:MAG: TonB-dependent receptor [Zetaproteobacteria bacterium]